MMAAMDDVATALRLRVRGEVLTDLATRREFSTDFGRLVERVPAVVVRPASVDDVVAVVRFAAEAGLGVTARGAAHSQNGQGLSAGGILLDMRSLAGEIVVDVERRCVSSLAGTLWRDLLAETLRYGLLPPVLTNNLDVTVGGTLSVAGIGVASFRAAAQVDQCGELEVVTGAGDRIVCSPTAEPELFDAVRAGLGLCGLITRATLRLRPCKPAARTFYLLYDDLGTLMADERTLIERGSADYLESWCVPCPQGFRPTPAGPQMFAEWFFPLHVTVEYDGEPPPGEAVLSGLDPYRRVHVADQPTAAFARRLDPLFALWRRSGFWASAHPWMETILPWATAEAYIRQVLAALPPPALGGGHILLWPARGRISTAPLFRTPDSDLVMGFGILPGVSPALASEAIAGLQRASDLAAAHGAKRYLSGYLGFDRARWEAHFGDRWPWLLEMKRRYDPQGILNRDLLPLG
jgi:cytokinin dehydrogenase